MVHENTASINMLAPLRHTLARHGRVVCRRRFGSDMPVPQSQNAKLFAGHPEYEGWESTIAWFYPTSFIMIAAVLFFEPETGIDTWAKEEASARLKLREGGFTDFVFGVHYKDLTDEQIKTYWDTFSSKAIRMTDDDDDEDDDDEDEEEEEEEDE